jgi:DNA-binding response OmpR family regulator
MLPEGSGLEVCRTLRDESSVPIVMVTARTTEEDKLHGLDLGADDYITKPFSPRELVARVRAVLRRTSRVETMGPPVLVFGNITLDRKQHKATLSDTLLRLTLTEFRLLETFLSAPERVFTRDELLQQALGRDSDALDRTVDVHVKNLRNKLATSGPGHCVIVTVHGVGYKLEGTADAP